MTRSSPALSSVICSYCNETIVILCLKICSRDGSNLAILWTLAKEGEVLKMLRGKWTGPKDRKYYHTLKKFEIVELGDVR